MKKLLSTLIFLGLTFLFGSVRTSYAASGTFTVNSVSLSQSSSGTFSNFSSTPNCTKWYLYRTGDNYIYHAMYTSNGSYWVSCDATGFVFSNDNFGGTPNDNYYIVLTNEDSSSTWVSNVFDLVNGQYTAPIPTNTFPQINPLSDTAINEGATYSVPGFFTDSDSTSWVATVDYGDGTGDQTLPLSGTDFTLDHLYKDNGVYIVTVDITDNQGSAGTGMATIAVNNADPIVGIIIAPSDPQLLNTTINTSASFTDPGTLDTHTASWSWGDTFTTPGTVSETDGSGTVTGSHSYATPGVYELKVSVMDNDLGTSESYYQYYVVVYDSSASGGFVTGAGTIDSPTGAYTADQALSGIARFGFISKYQPGASLPTGNTQFRFQIAQFTFNSSDYQWLVVAGAQAKFKGSGTVNGEGNYEFLLSGTDGEINGGGGADKFRIKIWDKDNDDAVVYDNQFGAGENVNPITAITGGNIVIH